MGRRWQITGLHSPRICANQNQWTSRKKQPTGAKNSGRGSSGGEKTWDVKGQKGEGIYERKSPWQKRVGVIEKTKHATTEDEEKRCDTHKLANGNSPTKFS